jgi:hypothetical protein
MVSLYLLSNCRSEVSYGDLEAATCESSLVNVFYWLLYDFKMSTGSIRVRIYINFYELLYAKKFNLFKVVIFTALESASCPNFIEI